MKTIRWLLALSLLLSLCACSAPKESETSAPAPTGYVGVQELARAVLDSQAGGEDLSELTGEVRTAYLTDVCGIPEGTWTEAAVYTADGVDARELILLRLSQEGDGETVVQALEEHRQSRLGDFYGYAPQEAERLENALVMELDGYAALLVCEDVEAARAALEGALDGETAAPTSVPTPTPTSTPAPTPTPTPEPTPALDISAFVPFHPPGEYDMSLYDTTAIQQAWTSGDESGLSEKDVAILAVCRELFDEHITDGMSDFEKELALHDALVRRGSYDAAVYDANNPHGRPDNTNPYGFLVEGYGICLGYATSFQLLMDLAGVECITVVGASLDSTQDHAWNMVCLEGEWYCVDPTWNDPTAWADVPEEDWDWCHHRYFNCTSAYMRESNHQWDYTNVPEATATRFFWDGNGPLPQ